ncbi:hypothetical protein DFP72DRAFT_1095694 [Ephemerocybe angulata]|uniref:Uncharacterized protein n=1 Tax=Ephemerocybe angulata TaxID=980116 RepID=A0A8H6HBK9_9AGAR|nr:hypothetical protein DFP72DRAFT_1095694 [Tulosesus angulatus]
MCDPMADISLDVIADGILLGTRIPWGSIGDSTKNGACCGSRMEGTVANALTTMVPAANLSQLHGTAASMMKAAISSILDEICNATSVSRGMPSVIPPSLTSTMQLRAPARSCRGVILLSSVHRRSGEIRWPLGSASAHKFKVLSWNREGDREKSREGERRQKDGWYPSRTGQRDSEGDRGAERKEKVRRIERTWAGAFNKELEWAERGRYIAGGVEVNTC